MVGLSLLGVGFLIPTVFNDTVAGVVRDIVDHTSTWPDVVRVAPALLAFVAHAGLMLALNVWLLTTRHFRRWFVMNAAVVLSSVLVSVLVMSLHSLAQGLGFERDGETIFVASAANVVAALTVLRPWIEDRPFRRLAWLALFISFGGALSAGFQSSWLGLPPIPEDIAGAQLSGAVALIGVGVVAGSIVALAFKTPSQLPGADAIRAGLARHGCALTELRPASVDARGSVPWRGVMSDGRQVFIKTLSIEQRAADLLYRLWRLASLRRSGDRAPFPSLRRAVEHEAFLALTARSQDIRTPPLISVGELSEGGFLLAYEANDGRTMAELAPAEINDDVLQRAWRELSQLRAAGIAHRDLRLANLLVDDSGEIWVVDFGFAELTMDDELLDRDVAQLLAATASVVGVERATSVAMATVGREVVASGLSWLQPLTLGAATRKSIGRDRDIRHLRDQIGRAAGIEEVELPELKRFTLRQVLLLGSLAAAVVIIGGQISDFGLLWESVSRLDLRLVGLVLAGSAATYVGATIAVMGSVPQRVRFQGTFAAQLAASFTNRLAPAGFGGMATNVRYLVRRGVPVATAVSAVGLNAVTGLVVHITVLLGLWLAFGSTAFPVRLPVPSARTLQLIAAAVVVASLATYLTAFGRRLVTTHIVPGLRTAVSSVVAVVRTPRRLVQLLAGSAIVTLAYTFAMIWSLRAVGADIGLIDAALAYLAGAAAALVAPTPGGLGVVEATLVAVYAAIGVPAETGIVAVLLFRFATYWAPILPGWVALNRLTRTHQL